MMKRMHVFALAIGASSVGAGVCSPIHAAQANIHTAAALRKLVASDVPATAKVIADAFPHSSPHSWGRALGLQEGRMEGYMAGYLPEPIAADSCFGMSDDSGGGGRLLSIIITEEFNPWKKEKDKEKDVETELEKSDEHGSADGAAAAAESYLAIDGILNDCKGIFLQELTKRGVQQASSSRCGYIAWMATSEEARGKGHAYNLVKRATDEMLTHDKRNFAVAYCVSPLAARVFVKNGYTCWGKIPYSSWQFNGKLPFAALPDEISIMVRQRGDKDVL